MLYFVGLKYSSATIACALTNLLPAFTFILAVLFRLVANKLDLSFISTPGLPNGQKRKLLVFDYVLLFYFVWLDKRIWESRRGLV